MALRGRYYRRANARIRSLVGLTGLEHIRRSRGGQAAIQAAVQGERKAMHRRSDRLRRKKIAHIRRISAALPYVAAGPQVYLQESGVSLPEHFWSMGVQVNDLRERTGRYILYRDGEIYGVYRSRGVARSVLTRKEDARRVSQIVDKFEGMTRKKARELLRDLREGGRKERSLILRSKAFKRLPPARREKLRRKLK